MMYGGLCQVIQYITLATLLFWGETKAAPRRYQSSCRDLLRECNHLARTGQCNYNPWNIALFRYMRQWCPLSCGTCRPTFRVTITNRCSVEQPSYCWRRQNYCSNASTKNACPVTCGLCGCRDENRHCNSWQRRGECWRNPAYMKVKCRKSCNTCYKKRSPTPKPRPKPKPKTKPKTKPPIHTPKSIKRPTTSPLVRPNSLLNSEFCGMTSVERVVGGQATKPGEWPWMVGLERKSKPGSIICGASLLTDEWILSAAHCFTKQGDGTDPTNYLVRIGEHHLKKTDGELIMNLDKIILHEKFDKFTYDNDIALLRLAKHIKFTPTIRPACLPDREETYAVGTLCTVTGWGRLGEGKAGPDVLHTAKVPIVDHKQCEQTFSPLGETVTARMLCAGHVKGGIDTCDGDSGGPLVCRSVNGGRYKQVGVVSWGLGCARPDLYGVYTKLSVMRNWVESKVNPRPEP